MENYGSQNWKIYINDGIVYVDFLAEYVIFEIIEEGIKARLEITKDKSYPMLSDIRKVKSLSREARQRISQKDSGSGTSAAAILTSSKIHEVICNFFYAIYKAPAPSKMFTNREKAIEWLQQFK